MDVGKVAKAGVEAAIRNAADATGVDFSHLMRTARRESSLNPDAKARTSSAAGLFQFVEQTWLSTVKKHGAKHGLGRWAEMIDRGSDGRLRVSGAEARRAVMNLRFEPGAAALMAGELAADSAAYLRGRIGREPSSGELYAAHFLGQGGAAKLIAAVERNPDALAVGLFPRAAAANRSIFYKGGRPATVSEVYANVTRTGGAAGAAPAVKPVAQPAAIVEAVEQMRDRAADLIEASTNRAERARRDAMLLEMILGQNGSGLPGGPLSGDFSALLGPTRR
jgi:hypothetical protein